MALQLSKSWKLARVASTSHSSNSKVLKSTELKVAKDRAKVQSKACHLETLVLRILETKESIMARKSLQREEITVPLMTVSTLMVWMNSGKWKGMAREDQEVAVVEAVEDHLVGAVEVLT